MTGTNLDPSVTATDFFGNLTGNVSGNVSGGTSFGLLPQLIAAAGATQGNATAIAKALTIIVTSTSSAKGIKLPTAATGAMQWVISLCTQGTKVYPNTNDKIGAAATNVAVVLAGFKGNLYAAKDATTWAVLKGA